MSRRLKYKSFSISRRFVNSWIVINAIVSTLLMLAFSLLMNDPEGWSFFFTWPIFAVAAVLTVFDCVVFVSLALKRPIEKPKRKTLYWLVAVIAIAPTFLITSYRFVNSQLYAAAQTRAKIQVSLPEAQRLISDCKVDTLYLNYGGGSQMRLREMVFMFPGAPTQNEVRVLNPNDFDQILALARKKEVEDKCGYIPTYDIRRARMQPANKWITLDEAKSLICSHSWLVKLWPNSYTPMPILPSPPATGILLSSQPSVWNDDVESNIILTTDTGGDIKNALSSLNVNPAACK